MHAGHIVEVAPTRLLFEAPQHPYTAQLIRATPATDSVLDALSSIPGNLPDLRRNDLPACRFRERCERASTACNAPLPSIDAEAARAVSCWHPLDQSRAAA